MRPIPRRAIPATTAYPRVELFLGYSFIRNVPANSGNRIAWVHGGSTSFALNVNRYLGFAFDFAGYHANRFGPLAPPNGGVVHASGNVFSYMIGPRLSLRHERFTPFAQVLAGFAHAGNVELQNCSGFGCSPLPNDNAFALAAGGGLDFVVQRHLALRLFQAEYFMTRFADHTAFPVRRDRQNDVRLSTGIVIRLGGDTPAIAPVARQAEATCSTDKTVIVSGSGDVISVRADATGLGNDSLAYTWTATDGDIDGTGPAVRWNSSGRAVGPHTFRVRVSNKQGTTAECSAEVRIDRPANRFPTVTCAADRSSVFVGDAVQVTATANDPDDDPLTYSWTVGERQSARPMGGTGRSARFATSGLAPGSYVVTAHVDDGRGGTAECSVNAGVTAPAPPAEVAELETRLALRSIYFATAQPTAENPDRGILESQQAVLAALATDFQRYLTYKAEAHLILGAHADSRGSAAYNRDLTDRRVERTRRFLVEHGVPAANIETKSFGKEQELDANQVKQQMQDNPEVSAEDRQKMLANIQVIVLANNRRVDVSLSTTGQQSLRRYPFNARDALILISTQPAQPRRRAKQVKQAAK